MKKFLSVILATMVIVSCLAGCNNSNNTTDNKSNVEANPALGTGELSDLMVEQPEGVVAIVNGENLTEEDLDEILPVLRYIYQKNTTDEDWDNFYAYAVQYMASAKMYELMFEEYNLELDEESLDKAFDAVVNSTGNSQEFYDEIAEYDVTEDQIKEFLRADQIYTELYEYAIANVEVTNDEIQAYFDENKDGFTDVTSRDFWQMLFTTKEEAQSVLDEILAGKTFDAALEEHNDSNSGYITTVAEGELVAPFNDIVFGLEENEVYNEVVESDIGYHIVMAKNFVNNKTYTLDEIRDNIESYLITAKEEEAMQNLVDTGAQMYEVTVF